MRPVGWEELGRSCSDEDKHEPDKWIGCDNDCGRWFHY